MKTKKEKSLLYLDVCVLCRPFDDQTQMRIRLETDAFYLIFEAIKNGFYGMAFSRVHLEEIAAIKDVQEKYELMGMLNKYGKELDCDLTKIRSRAEELHARKFGIADAAHLAFAEAISNIFISCDDKLINKCGKANIMIPVLNPVEFCVREDLQ